VIIVRILSPFTAPFGCDTGALRSAKLTAIVVVCDGVAARVMPHGAHRRANRKAAINQPIHVISSAAIAIDLLVDMGDSRTQNDGSLQT
jgi:hypothetical protein